MVDDSNSDNNEAVASDNTDVLSLGDFLQKATLLGMLFNLEEIELLIEQNPAREVAENTILAIEGRPSEDVFFATNSTLQVISSSEELGAIDATELGVGRTFNLFALLRGLPYQYSLKAPESCQVIQLSWSIVQDRLNQLPVVHEYLKRMTDDHIFRVVAKDLEAADCGTAFRMELLNSIELRNLKRHLWIVAQGQKPNDAFMLLSGEILAVSKSNSSENARVDRWNIPSRVWLHSHESIEETPSSFGMRTLSDCRVLAVSGTAGLELRKTYPEDHARWMQWLDRSSIASNSKPPEYTQQAVDIEEVFASAKTKRKWGRYPWVQQNDTMDCGAACLSMISQYHGKALPIQYWRNLLSTDRTGTSIYDLCKTAERKGFVSYALSTDSVSDISKKALPVIALRKYHYVVIYEVTSKSVTYGDPAQGVAKLSIEEFEDGFEKIYIALQPTEVFHEIATPPSSNHMYGALISKFKSELAMAAACSVMLVFITMIPPLIIQEILDDVLATQDFDLLKMSLIALVSYVIFNAVMTWFRGYFMQFVAIKIDFMAKSTFLQRLLSLPYSFIGARHVGDFTRRIQEFETVRLFLTEKSLSFVLSLVSLVLYLGVLALYSWKTAAAVLAVAPVFMLCSMLFTKSLVNQYALYFQSKVTEDGFISDLFRGMLAIKVNGAELAVRRRAEDMMVRSLNERYKFLMLSIALNGVVVAIFELSKYSVLALSVWLAIRGELTPGQVVAISMLAGEVLLPFQKMAIHWADFQEAKLIIHRINDVLLTPPEESPAQLTGQKKSRFDGKIEFVDVWFRYGGETADWILKGVSFSISPGEQVAVAGKSGSGKSTIALLLNRTYVPQKGQILIDGKDYREYDLAWLRSQVGFVTQEPFLFPGSICENIAFSGESWDEESLHRAAATVDAAEFIEKKPNRYFTFIPAGGHGFSGGEKQRLAMARVVHRNPGILVFDESSSNLDGATERNFLDRMRAWAKGKTVISIAHRHSNVRTADTVILIDDGRVAAQGPPSYLDQNSKLYRVLFQLDELRESKRPSPQDKDAA